MDLGLLFFLSQWRILLEFFCFVTICSFYGVIFLFRIRSNYNHQSDLTICAFRPWYMKDFTWRQFFFTYNNEETNYVLVLLGKDRFSENLNLLAAFLEFPSLELETIEKVFMQPQKLWYCHRIIWCTILHILFSFNNFQF